MAEPVTRCRLSGIPLLASAVVGWPLRAGVAPVEQTFDVRKDDVSALKRLIGKPVTLTIQSNEKTITVEQLWIREIRPGPNPFIFRVRVADRRWFLEYGIIEKDYNIRRNVGFKRVGDTSQPALSDVVPDAWYEKWSLKDENAAPPAGKWNTIQMLEDVFEQAQETEKRYTGTAPPKVVIASEIRSTERALSVEGLTITDSADSGLARALKYIPEAAFYIDLKGTWKVVSRVSGKEIGLLAALKPALTTGGWAEVVENEASRPKDVEVYFDIETEFRNDYLEIASGGTTTSLGKDRLMKNVFISPDFELTNGVPADRSPIVQGTPVAVDDILAYWGSPPGIGGTALTHDILQKAFVPFIDLFSALLVSGSRDPDNDWAARIATAQRDYRQLYQLNPQMRDRFRSIRARRVGLVDAENGTLGKAVAYTDYFQVGTQRSYHKTLSDGNFEYGVNVTGYPTGTPIRGVASFTGAERPAPATLSIEDEDQGLVRINFQSDPLRLYQVVLPSKLTRADGSALLPSGDLTSQRHSISFDTVLDARQVPKLSSEHKLCFILSGVLAAPNDKRRLYKVKVEPKDVEKMLPPAARAGLKSGKGPTWQVRVSGGQDGARALIRWSDTRAEDIDKLLGILDGEPNLDGIVMNAAPQNDLENQAASLNEVAKAVAARIWARFADHVEGEITGLLKQDAELDGWVDEIVHQVETTGNAGTTARFPDKGVELDVDSILSSSTRAILRREVQPK